MYAAQCYCIPYRTVQGQRSWCQFIVHGWFPIQLPLTPSSYLSPFRKYLRCNFNDIELGRFMVIRLLIISLCIMWLQDLSSRGRHRYRQNLSQRNLLLRLQSSSHLHQNCTTLWKAPSPIMKMMIPRQHRPFPQPLSPRQIPRLLPDSIL